MVYPPWSMLSGGCVRLLLLVLLVRLLLAAPPNKFSVVLVCPETHMYTIGVVAAALYSVPGYGAPPLHYIWVWAGMDPAKNFGGGYAVPRDKILVPRPAIATFLSEFRVKLG